MALTTCVWVGGGGVALLTTRPEIVVLCPFALYFLRYAVRSFYTMSRISLADGKRAG